MNIQNYITDLTRYPSAWIGHGEFAIKLVNNFKPSVTVDLGVDYHKLYNGFFKNIF